MWVLKQWQVAVKGMYIRITIWAEYIAFSAENNITFCNSCNFNNSFQLIILLIFNGIAQPDFNYNMFQYPQLHKGKSVPLQAWSGPEGSRKLGFPGFMTKAQEGGKVVSLTHRPHLPPGNPPGTHFC